jgi:uncharacterized protein (DUF1778 family)
MARIARTEKLDLRVSSEAKRKLRAAAEVRHKTVSEFVLDSALSAADEALLDQRRLVLGPEDWEAFMKALDEPPAPNERLERLLGKPNPFD